ncbi:MAG: M23 family metallopeptidase [Brevibacterium aurantiacum]|uniref:M23 family metallopeptidase n=1 Tax=Brevibacterium aurantiacum TaxID=273384 RepID=UPI003F8E085A
MKKAIAVLAALVLLSPFIAVVGIGTVANPFVLFQGTCDTAGMNVGPVPDELEAETKKGESVTLNKTQLERAAAIITGGSEIEGVTENGVIIALMAALTESTLRQLANSSAYPESTDYPNDGDAADHDSLGLFQMRPQSGWGSVEELMDVDYQVRAFFGGEDGPNHPSPRGVLDIPGWEDMDRGEAAQSVEVSAYPDRYTNWEPVAEKVLDTLTENARDGGGGGGEREPEVPETGQLVFPLPEGTYTRTSGFGPRTDPITGESRLHGGVDYAAPDGTPILALADGLVVTAHMSGGSSGTIIIEHTIDGESVATMYVHMWEHGIHVQPGDRVQAGDHIGDVGSSGHSTGPHLHLQVHPGGAQAEPIDPEPWLADHDLESGEAPESPQPPGGCR